MEGGVATGVVGGTGPVSGEVFLEAQLDDPVQPISIPTPRYPPVLQSAGIAGAVDLQYVVDTTGHAETNSFKVLKTTHPAFVEPAKEAITKGVFKPAKFKGQAGAAARAAADLIQGRPVAFIPAGPTGSD